MKIKQLVFFIFIKCESKLLKKDKTQHLFWSFQIYASISEVTKIIPNRRYS